MSNKDTHYIRDFARAALLPAAIFFLVTLATALSPYLLAWKASGTEWKGIYPEITHEYLYYLSQMRASADGYPSSVPYYAEYRTEGSSANSSLLISIAALPLSMGFSPDATNMINTALWGTLFLLGLYTFSLSWGHKRCLSTALALLVYWGANIELSLRPAVMQIVYPLFFLFPVILLVWLIRPSISRSLVLAGYIALLAYAYVYAGMIALATFGLLATYLLFKERFAIHTLRSVSLVAAVTGALLIPYALHTTLLMRNPLYKGVVSHFGGIEWHVLDPRVYTTGALVALLFAAFYFSRKAIVRCNIPVVGSNEGWTVVFALMAGTLFVQSANFITGTDVDYFHHANRFMVPMLFLVAIPALTLFFRAITKEKNASFRVFVVITILLFSLTLLDGARSSFAAFDWARLYAKDAQQMGGVLAWIKGQPGQQVILDRTDLSEYIPVYTAHKVILTDKGKYFLVPESELEERYLLAQIGIKLDIQKLIKDAPAYFAGDSYRNKSQRLYWYARRCNLVLPAEFCPGIKYPSDFDEESLRRFPELLARYASIDVAPLEFLKKYHVSIAVFRKGEPLHPIFQGMIPAYEDDSYRAYNLTQLDQ